MPCWTISSFRLKDCGVMSCWTIFCLRLKDCGELLLSHVFGEQVVVFRARKRYSHPRGDGVVVRSWYATYLLVLDHLPSFTPSGAVFCFELYERCLPASAAFSGVSSRRSGFGFAVSQVSFRSRFVRGKRALSALSALRCAALSSRYTSRHT